DHAHITPEFRCNTGPGAEGPQRTVPVVKAAASLCALGPTTSAGGLSPAQGARLLAVVQAGGRELGETRLVAAHQGGLEEHLGTLKALLADGDELAVGELIVYTQILQAQAKLLLWLECRVAALFLDVLDDVQVVVRELVAGVVEQLQQRRLHVEQLMAHADLLAGVTSISYLRAALAHSGGDEVEQRVSAPTGPASEMACNTVAKQPQRHMLGRIKGHLWEEVAVSRTWHCWLDILGLSGLEASGIEEICESKIALESM
ncbi:hypothetical protein EI555_013685, partial [Monodon monoceros]